MLDPLALGLVLDAVRDVVGARWACFVPSDPASPAVWSTPIASAPDAELVGLDRAARAWLADGSHPPAPAASVAGAEVTSFAVTTGSGGPLGALLFLAGPDAAIDPAAAASAVAVRMLSAVLDAMPDVSGRQALIDSMSVAPGTRTAFAVSVDRFGVVNDVYGHAAGDLVLRATEQRLAQWAGPGGRVARAGGARYLVLRPGLENERDARNAAETLRDLVAAPIDVAGHQVSRSASVGVVVDPNGVATAADLLTHAVRASVTARSAGGDAVRVFDDATASDVLSRLQLELELHEALRTGQLRMHYQPELDLRNGRIVAVEALLRWQHPERGLLGAERFVPDTEQTHTFTAVQRWIIDETCRQLAQWQREGVADSLVLRVNISAPQLVHGDLTATLIGSLERHQLRGDQVCVELTERRMPADTTALAAQLSRWRERGVTVAIDDFGTGDGTLTHLLTLPIDIVKIDQTFVARLLSDERSTAIVAAVISLARSLHLEVVAEGVDGRNTAAELVRLGCTRGQGNALATAMDPDLLADLLRSQKRVVVTD